MRPNGIINIAKLKTDLQGVADELITEKMQKQTNQYDTKRRYDTT